MPYVQENYRVQTDRANTAIAGLSMGGSQTLNIAMAHPGPVRVHRRVQLRAARRLSGRRSRVGADARRRGRANGIGTSGLGITERGGARFDAA